MRIKEDYDGAEPSGNSVAILNLLRLAYMFGNEEYGKSAERTLHAFASKMAAQPTAMPQMLVALMRHITPPQQIVLAGDEPGALPRPSAPTISTELCATASGRCTRCCQYACRRWTSRRLCLRKFHVQVADGEPG